MHEARTEYRVHDFIQKRWSPCQFAADRPVADADLTFLFEAARWGTAADLEGGGGA